MWNGNAHKRFTACGDADAELLLETVLREIGDTLSGTGLTVVLGGSYGRGDGGVRMDRENGLLYNDLDFFVFARNTPEHTEHLLKEVAEKYEKELKVDVDFSRIITVKDIQSNASRLMMQELKRGYILVCGEDLLETYLPELPADQLPFSEACRLLLNRGMGLLLEGEKIADDRADTDFILRNLYKAILGTGDAMMIAAGEYRWKIADRLDYMVASGCPEEWSALYREAVAFKCSPHRTCPEDLTAFRNRVRDFYLAGMDRCAGGAGDLAGRLYDRCKAAGETSLKNYLKYMIRTRTVPFGRFYTIPAAATLLPDLCVALEQNTVRLDRTGKLYRHWLIFN